MIRVCDGVTMEMVDELDMEKLEKEYKYVEGRQNAEGDIIFLVGDTEWWLVE